MQMDGCFAGFPIVPWLVVSLICFIFTPKIVEDFQFDEHIFQLGGLTR